MFKRSKKRIVAAIMISLVAFLITTLFVIYLSSYYGIKKENTDMLRRHVEMYELERDHVPADADRPDKEPSDDRSKEPKDLGGMPGRNERAFEISTFYTVVFDSDGEVIEIDNGINHSKDTEELESTARKVLDGGKSQGKTDGMLYLVDKGDGYTLVAFMDNTVTDNSLRTLLTNTLIAGGLAIVVLFFISVFIAGRIVTPLEENDLRQRRFVSDAGHELKTPLAVIGTNTELLAKQIGNNEWLSNIQYENERMSELVRELLDLSHAESAGVRKEETDLSRIVMGEVLPFESMAFERGMALESEVEDGISVVGNATQLGRLTSILLDNAIRHSDGGSDVFLSLKRDHKSALLTVSNPGKEIPREKLDRLFERFYRVDDARSGEGAHYGLGLAIAKAVVETHGGEISVSCRDGRVIFTVTLPLSK